MRLTLLSAALLAGAAIAAPASAFDYRSAAGDAVILYDAPSTKAQRRFVVGRDYPFEVVLTLGDWVKVRDIAGDISWAEARYLSPRRTVVVTAAVAEVRKSPDESAPAVFKAEKDVILELLAPAGTGWLQVKHRDGATGYIRSVQVWGG